MNATEIPDIAGWLTAEQAGDYVHMSPRTVKRAASAGSLVGSYLAGRWLFQRADLDRWIKRHANRGAGARSRQTA